MAIGRITGQMLSANLARSGSDLTFETNLLALDVSNSRVGIGTASPATTLHISATDALRLPAGTDAQRPGSPANGDLRYNSDQTTIEGYANGGWANLASGTELKDADEDTKVNVEASADLDEIHFDIAGTQRGKITASTIEWGVTGISATASTITGLTTNGDITLTPNGTGKVIVTDGTTLQTNTADINGGAIDGVTIGAASAATHLNVSGGTVTITDTGGDGTIDGVIIGGTTAAAGSFTSLNASGNATISGNLTVNGTTTTIDSETLTIEDPLLTLAKNNSGGAANTFDQGLFVNRGSDDNVSFLWDESADQFAFAVTSGEDGTTAGAVTIDSYAAVKAGVATVSDLETGSISAADGTAAATIADSTGVITIPSAVLTTADINGGTADGVTIGGSTAAAGTFTSLNATTGGSLTGTWSDLGTVTTVDINGGSLDGVTIGASSAGAGTFTTLSDQAGDVRTVPAVGTKTSSYTLTTADTGKYVQVGTGGSITIPDATFSE